MRAVRFTCSVSACVFVFSSALLAEQAPTLRLPDTVAPTGYRAELSLDPAKPSFAGSIAIQIDVKQPVKTIWLNATEISVEEASLETGGKNMIAKAETSGQDFLGLTFNSQVPAGPAEIRIRYTGKIRQQDSSAIFHMSEDSNNYLFTQFENTDARAAFPCFDEPSYKTPWQLTLEIPQNNTAISNTSPESQQTRGDRIIYKFKQTKPLPSYLVAFAVGPFDYVDAGTAGRNHVPVRIVTPKGHASEAKYAAQNTATILTREEGYFGIPYAYDKLDNVAIPVTFGFAAMENAGMVTYAQDILLADPARDTTHRQREFAEVAAHELAHQWVGDLVTTAWWNDIWLNEAFATWMEKKLVAEWKPEWHTRVDDVNDKLLAERIDSLPAARKIRQEIRTKDDISNAFDDITYQKGAAVIAMFENWIGPEQFRKGVHSYLERYAFKTATAPEFLSAVSVATGKNITEPFDTFLNQAGVPLVSVALDCRSGAPVLKMDQQRYLPHPLVLAVQMSTQQHISKVASDELWSIPVCVRYGTADTSQSACTLMTESSMNWKLDSAKDADARHQATKELAGPSGGAPDTAPVLREVLKGVKSCPEWLDVNANAIGYYRVNYGRDLLASLTSGDVVSRLHAPERVDLIGDVSALAQGNVVPMGDALSLVGTFHADPQHDVVEQALKLALQPRLNLVAQNLEPNYRRFLLQNFDDRARQLGWTPKPGESADDRLLRPSLVSAVATYAGDRQLANEGCSLAAKWFTDPDAIDPNLVGAVLGTAAYYGDKSLVERFIAEYKQTKDVQKRRRILDAMARFRDPAALQMEMQAVLSGQIPFIDGFRLLFAGEDQPATRTLSFNFLKTRYSEIMAKRPTGGGFDLASMLPRVGNTLCDRSSLAQFDEFFKPRLNDLLGAPRTFRQVQERITACIADKDSEESSVSAFLEHY